MIHDAIVVGAGLSGLVCARRLIREGATVRVLEARERVGGRLWNGTLAGTTVDLGGQWMSVGQPRLAALAAELGITSFPQRRDGRTLLDGGDRAPGLFARLATAVSQLRAARRITRASRAIDVLDPMHTAGAAALDGESLASYLSRTIPNDTARERIAIQADLVLAADPADLSLLHYLATFRATGGYGAPGPDLPGGGREHRFVGGAQGLALRLAAELGDVVQLGAAGRTIRTGPPCSVSTDGGTERARRVVLALPPAGARSTSASGAHGRPSRLDHGQVVSVPATAPVWRTRVVASVFPPARCARRCVAEAGGSPDAAPRFSSDPRPRFPRKRSGPRAPDLATLGERWRAPTAHRTGVSTGPRCLESRCVAGFVPGSRARGALARTERQRARRRDRVRRRLARLHGGRDRGGRARRGGGARRDLTSCFHDTY